MLQQKPSFENNVKKQATTTQNKYKWHCDQVKHYMVSLFYFNQKWSHIILHAVFLFYFT